MVFSCFHIGLVNSSYRLFSTVVNTWKMINYFDFSSKFWQNWSSAWTISQIPGKSIYCKSQVFWRFSSILVTRVSVIPWPSTAVSLYLPPRCLLYKNIKATSIYTIFYSGKRDLSLSSSFMALTRCRKRSLAYWYRAMSSVFSSMTFFHCSEVGLVFILWVSFSW